MLNHLFIIGVLIACAIGFGYGMYSQAKIEHAKNKAKAKVRIASWLPDENGVKHLTYKDKPNE